MIRISNSKSVSQEPVDSQANKARVRYQQIFHILQLESKNLQKINTKNQKYYEPFDYCKAPRCFSFRDKKELYFCKSWAFF